MKTLGVNRTGAIALLLCAQITSAMAITFTHDAFISFADVSHDGQDIVITNCTLTVDGAHAFNSLTVLNGGVLTHSPLPYGPQQFTFSVTGESHSLSSTSPVALNSTNVDADTIVVMDASGNIFYTENVDYIVTVSNQLTELTLTTNSAIAEGATVLVDYDWSEIFQGFNLSISNDADVTPGGAINVSGKGYAGGIGFMNGAGGNHATNFPFSFTAGGGAGHGGNGGMSSSSARGGATYDSTTNPGILGSGGGSGSSDGGAGGGVATLSVGGNFQIDGQLMANGFNGTNAHSGGGAGGGILISASNFSGLGLVSAKGGAGDLPDGGGGGGGRIAIYFATNNFVGSISAFGGGGSTAGGAGTIYLQSTTNSAGQLFIVNGGKRGTNTTFSAAVGDLTISGGAIAQSPSSTFSVTNLFVGSNSWFIPSDSLPLNLTVTGNATVESNAVINADSKSSAGPGAGSSGNGNNCVSGSGGGYGGYGGAGACGTPGGVSYGSITEPSDFGSPGGGTPGARGGGVIELTVGGTLSLAGAISANGAPTFAPASGGGSGGSVLLNAGTLLGGGTISANGGLASNAVSGGGAGGRVAVYVYTNLFSGATQAHGGAGANAGGPGTVYFTNKISSIHQVIVDNGGLVGFTLLQFISGAYDLQISGGAIVTNSPLFPSLNLGNFFIGSNSWLTVAPSSSPTLTFNATDVTIQQSGGITTDGESSSTVGAGQFANSSGGGGANGGNGGASLTNAAGGIASGSVTEARSAGAVGGSGQAGPGGKGGGVISLEISHSLLLDGAITANGATGGGLNSGGGSGGSINVQAGTISGAGTISANGGAANDLGGGGGGGRVVVSYATNSFAGSLTAYGGSGANYGGAGTIYVARVPTLFGVTPQLTVDNGGVRGAITPLSIVSGTFDLTVTGGAALSNSVSTTLQIGNLLVGSNSVIQTFPLAQQMLIAASNVTVQAGGSINADGASPGGQGNGQTLNGTGGGGGCAGSGGASALNALGGNAFSDSLTLPFSVGSRGGSGSSSIGGSNGGNGGGSLKMAVVGTLRIDGRISADGVTSTSLNSGGGSGGTVLLSAKTLSGAGTISANGGPGNAAGGGGGGGHIAVSYNTNQFAGNFTARGGDGANFGGAGIIYLASLFQGQLAQLTIDNGGAVGGGTPLFTSLPSPLNLNITGGAIFFNGTSSSTTLANLLVGSNSTWIASSPSQQILTVNTNATIQGGGKIIADGAVSGGSSQGQTFAGTGGGGGHGGYGGASLSNALGGTVTSDSITQPTGTGSRGGGGLTTTVGGNGGGALQITVRGALQLDGRISADGVITNSINSGGGSGGSIFLTVGKISGSGSISANGGAGNNIGGGGGGGRIAVSYNTNLFLGSMTARGGAGANRGGAGTIYTASSFLGDGKPSSQLIVDNGGFRGTNTPLSNPPPSADVVIGSGAAVNLQAGLVRWNNLLIASNAILGAPFSPIGATGPGPTVLSMIISSNLTIQPGGAIALDGSGSAANFGAGAGVYISGSGGGGGGHGGLGSAGISGNGGSNYDLIFTPGQVGSGGGSQQPASGSAGGGAVELTVTRTLNLGGTITANGLPGVTGAGAGGGSGGSIWLTAGTLSGGGKISADGGDGDIFSGGGGGGGRVAVYFSTNAFSGTISAHGGAGVSLSGGAGTIYLKTNSASIGLVILDNGGAAGTNTPLSSLTQTSSLSLRNGARAASLAPLTLQNLSIGSGSGFFAASLTQLNLTMLGDALVDTNGTISADSAGYGPGTGLGGGSADFFGDGSGGGYGGLGGMSFFGAPGGGIYGSSNQPVDFGSGGGMMPLVAGFSQGGGAIHLTVNGKLTVNGNISANGDDGFIAGSGGGAGGSLWITAQNLAGNGSFAADGGIGESGEGGGGGGGRIAIYAGANSFSGTISAFGGDGAMPGQNGTIYFPTQLLISGNITDTGGTAIAGITLQPSGLGTVVTDTSGSYSLTVPPTWSGTITPAGTAAIIPSTRTYANLCSNAPNQNFLVALSSAFTINNGQFDGTNVGFNWYGISGVTYQPLCSSNLVDWTPYGPPLTGSNAPVTFAVPTTNAPQWFFRLGVSY